MDPLLGKTEEKKKKPRKGSKAYAQQFREMPPKCLGECVPGDKVVLPALNNTTVIISETVPQWFSKSWKKKGPSWVIVRIPKLKRQGPFFLFPSTACSLVEYADYKDPEDNQEV